MVVHLNTGLVLKVKLLKAYTTIFILKILNGTYQILTAKMSKKIIIISKVTSHQSVIFFSFPFITLKWVLITAYQPV